MLLSQDTVPDKVVHFIAPRLNGYYIATAVKVNRYLRFIDHRRRKIKGHSQMYLELIAIATSKRI